MDNREVRIFSASINPNLPTLDLHGHYPSEALDELELFIFHSRSVNEFEVRVVYGGGTGKLKSAVLEYARAHKLVEEIVDEGGSCILLLFTN